MGGWVSRGGGGSSFDPTAPGSMGTNVPGSAIFTDLQGTDVVAASSLRTPNIGTNNSNLHSLPSGTGALLADPGSASEGDVLTYDGSAWVAGTAAGPGYGRNFTVAAGTLANGNNYPQSYGPVFATVSSIGSAVCAWWVPAGTVLRVWAKLGASSAGAFLGVELHTSNRQDGTFTSQVSASFNTNTAAYSESTSDPYTVQSVTNGGEFVAINFSWGGTSFASNGRYYAEVR